MMDPTLRPVRLSCDAGAPAKHRGEQVHCARSPKHSGLHRRHYVTGEHDSVVYEWQDGSDWVFMSVRSPGYEAAPERVREQVGETLASADSVGGPVVCPITGRAIIHFNPDGSLDWERGDPEIHVSRVVLNNEHARNVVETYYKVGEKCPYDPGRMRHARLHDEAAGTLDEGANAP